MAPESRGGVQSGLSCGNRSPSRPSNLYLLLHLQIAWLSIGLASWKFRRAWLAQGRPLSEMKFRASWTWPWGPPFVVWRHHFTSPRLLSLAFRLQMVAVTVLILGERGDQRLTVVMC